MIDDRQPQPIQLVVPLPLEKTAAQLQAKHESATFWAWRYQTRIWVKTTVVDANTVAYEVKRVPKSWLSPQSSLTSVKGTMHRLDNYTTLVVGKPEMSLLWTMFLGLLFIGMMVIGAIVYQTAPPEEVGTAYLLIGFPLLITPIILGGAWWDAWTLKKLVNNTLGDVAPLYGSRGTYDGF